jgi:Rieske Fe-S protein
MSTPFQPYRPAHWKEDFPVACDEDGYVTRREFTKFLGLTSLAFTFGTFAAALRKLWKARMGGTAAAMRVAGIDEIPVGGYKLFRYPDDGAPCILLRLEQAKFVAFDQRCTHLTCPVHFNATLKQLVCPCHHGYFSAEDGRPLAGPPKRPLTQLEVSLDDSHVCVGPSAEDYT